MANLGGALQVLGQGLFQITDRRMQREEKDIEAMRREALAKMQMDHDTELADKKIAADKELFDKNTEARAGEQAKEFAFRAGERAASDESANKRLGMQLTAAQASELRRAREDVRSNYTRLITSVDSQIKGLQTEYAKALSAAGGKLDAESEKYFAGLATSLQQQRDDLARSQVYELQRVDSGGYGKGLSEDEVRGMMPAGAKGPRQDNDLFPAEPQAQPGAQPGMANAGLTPQASQAVGAKPADSLSGLGAEVPPPPQSQSLMPSAPVDTLGGMGGAVPPPPAPANTQGGLGGAVPPPPDPQLFAPPPAPPPTPIQMHAQGYARAAETALQLIRAGKPVDPALARQARQMGFGTLARQHGWTQNDLSAIGF